MIDQKDLSPELYATRYGQDKGLLMLILRALERASWRTANHVFCISRSHRRIILERGGVPATSTTIGGNGPLLAKTKPRPAEPELKRGKDFLVCWIGVMGVQDRVDLALHAVHQLVHQLGRTDCHFTLDSTRSTGRLQRWAAARLAGPCGSARDRGQKLYPAAGGEEPNDDAISERQHS